MKSQAFNAPKEYMIKQRTSSDPDTGEIIGRRWVLLDWYGRELSHKAYALDCHDTFIQWHIFVKQVCREYGLNIGHLGDGLGDVLLVKA